MMDQIEKPMPITPRIEPVMITAAVIWLILIRQSIWCVDSYEICSILEILSYTIKLIRNDTKLKPIEKYVILRTLMSPGLDWPNKEQANKTL